MMEMTQSNSCQREFCLNVNKKNGTTVFTGERFDISVAKTLNHGAILLDERRKRGIIEIH